MWQALKFNSLYKLLINDYLDHFCIMHISFNLQFWLAENIACHILNTPLHIADITIIRLTNANRNERKSALETFTRFAFSKFRSSQKSISEIANK